MCGYRVKPRLKIQPGFICPVMGAILAYMPLAYMPDQRKDNILRNLKVLTWYLQKPQSYRSTLYVHAPFSEKDQYGFCLLRSHKM